MIFLHQIKLNWHGWSPRRVHGHSMSSLSMECPWSAHGLLMDCSYCSWSAHGVHGKVWGSVKYSNRHPFELLRGDYLSISGEGQILKDWPIHMSLHDSYSHSSTNQLQGSQWWTVSRGSINGGGSQVPSCQTTAHIWTVVRCAHFARVSGQNTTL